MTGHERSEGWVIGKYATSMVGMFTTGVADTARLTTIAAMRRRKRTPYPPGAGVESHMERASNGSRPLRAVGGVRRGEGLCAARLTVGAPTRLAGVRHGIRFACGARRFGGRCRPASYVVLQWLSDASFSQPGAWPPPLAQKLSMSRCRLRRPLLEVRP